MTITRKFVDVEDAAKAWLLSTSVSDLISNKAYMAMPLGSPLPTVILSRVGGGPSSGSDVPVDIARISFACWAKSRPQAKKIAETLVSEAESLADNGGFTLLDPILEVGVARIHVAEVLAWLWLPDQVSDTPRYIVDVRFTVTTL